MTKMGILWGRVKGTPGLVSDVVLLALALALGIATTSYLLANYQMGKQGDTEFSFSAEFDQAPAVQLSARQEVRIAGVDVGKISTADASDNGLALLGLTIDGQHTVYENARVVMRSKTPLNIMYVTLDPGGPPAAPLEPGGTIPVTQTDRVIQPYELLDHLDERARHALTDLVMQADVALADSRKNLPRGLAGADAAATSYQDVVDALQTRRKNLRHLVTSVAQISAAAGEDDERLASLVDSLTTTLAVLATHDDQLAASIDQLPGVTRTLRASMRSAGSLSSELSPVLESLSEVSGELPGTLRRLNSTVDNVGDLFEEAAPVVTKARPVVRDLRPLVSDLRGSLAHLSPVVSTLPNATERIVPWLDHLGAFLYNTASSFSLGDVNGGMGRANVVVKLTEPTGVGQ